MTFTTLWRGLLGAGLAATALGGNAKANPVVIPDFSFENTLLAPGGATAGGYAGTNWGASGNGGVFIQSLTNTFFTPTSSNTLSPTADGTNYAVENLNTFTGYLWQDLGPLQPNTIYTLTIAVGQSLAAETGSGFFGFVNGPTPFQALLASAPVDNSVLTPGTFADTSLVFTTGYEVSGNLTILMEGTNGQQILFDNVRLDASPAPQAPTSLLPGLSTPSGVVYVGTVVTLSEDPAGTTPFTYQWQSDNGTGGVSFTSVASATSMDYAVNTSGFAAGSSFEYRVVVSNSFGGSTSAPITLTAVQGQPVLTQDTLPSTGSSDVVGSQVIFTASFDGSRPITYQWQVDYGSGPGPIAGATNTTLTLNNLQQTDSGSYSLVASNAFGSVASTPSAFTANPVPQDVGGVVISPANQYGLGGQTDFTPTWLIATNSLIAGTLPTSSVGNFQVAGCGGIPHLTDGIFGILYPQGNTSPDLASAGNPVGGNSGCGSVIVYTLPASANGYDITNIVTYGGWSDGGRDQQSYDVYYSTIANPTSFNNELTTVNYLPSPNDPNTDQSATRISITSTNGNGVLVHNVAAVELFFAIQAGGFNENGFQGYAEFQVDGMPSAAAPILTTNTQPVTGSDVVGSSVTIVAGASSAFPLAYQWRVDTGSGPANVPGATNTTLTLNNLQLSDAGSYSLLASNATGFVISTPNSFVVNQAAGPDGLGVIDSPANQTGTGPAFTPTWAIAPGSLIAGTLPSALTPSANNFGAENSGGAPILTDGEFGFVGSGDNATLATCGSGQGQTLTYTLTGSESGYNVTNIEVYGGWSDGGRDEQAYTIYYSSVTDPTNFIEITAYDYLPSLPGTVPNATRITYTSGTVAPLATNVAEIKFDFTTPNGGGENGYEGYAEISVYGFASASIPVPPYVTSDTLPTTGSDVVGSQVTFTASFSSSSPISYQWEKDAGSGPAPIAGATTAQLTLSNLQLLDAASYSLVASNTLGVATSTPNSFTVNPAPAPANGILIAEASQTWSGVAFIPTWAAPAGSLIAGALPSSVGSGSFSNQYCGGIPILTDGQIGPIGGNDGLALASCGSGSGTTLTYTLSGSSSGYDLSKIITYGGWSDGGRDEQAYTIYYSTVADPSTFIELTPADYNPTIPGAVANATRVTLTSASGGELATHVAAVEFNFTTPNGGGKNGWEGYSELSLFGAASAPLDTLTVHSTMISGGQLILTGTGGTPNGSYTWLTSTNVATPLTDWTTNSVGAFDGSGAFSNAIPVTSSPSPSFFVLRIP